MTRGGVYSAPYTVYKHMFINVGKVVLGNSDSNNKLLHIIWLCDAIYIMSDVMKCATTLFPPHFKFQVE